MAADAERFVLYMKNILRFITFVSLLSCIGCAFGTREVLLKNSVVNSSDTTAVPRNHVVCFDGFSDEQNRRTIGLVQNGYGMHTAQVLAQNNVAEWINWVYCDNCRELYYKVNRKEPLWAKADINLLPPTTNYLRSYFQ